MNYNANNAARQSLPRKIKRVSDVNAMGYNPYEQQSTTPSNPSLYPNLNTLNPSTMQQNVYPQPTNNQGFPAGASQSYAGTPAMPSPYNQSISYNNNPSNLSQTQQQSQFGGVFTQPLVQDMAMQYGQQLANTGTTLIKQEVERYVPVSKLKYYFAVDTKYVVSKLALLFFPFTHTDWSMKYEQDSSPVQPRFELNAPDLYIPTMAYVTYVLVAGLVLGLQHRFTPEQLGVLASSALAWCLVELAVYRCTLYIMHIETTLRTLDLLAYIGYKFVGIIFSILVSLIGARTAYYGCLGYSNLALAFFLVRTLKAQVLSEANVPGEDVASSYYGQREAQSGASTGTKRRLYFLLFFAISQQVLSWWLSFHLIGNSTVVASATKSTDF